MNKLNTIQRWLYGMAVALVCTTASWSGTAAQQGCIPLKQGQSQPGMFRYGPDAPAPGRTVIDKPGHYCLSENLRVEGHYWPVTPEGDKLFSDDELIVMLAADDITLDFHGHSATSDAGLHAAVRTPHGAPGAVVPNNLPTIVPKNLTIKNGTIKVSRHGTAVEVFGLGPQIALVNIVQDITEKDRPQYQDDPKFLREMVEYENAELAKLRATILPNAAAYPIRNLHIENMRLRSKDYAVVLQGAGSVIRDSVIETDSGTALWLYGPNAVIENNTIIVHCLAVETNHQGGSYCEDMDAPIRLMHGDGAVIRNNRFILRDRAHPRVLSVFDTGSFTFEGNTITGLQDVNHAAKAFSGTLQLQTVVPNRLDNSPTAWVKAWFE